MTARTLRPGAPHRERRARRVANLAPALACAIALSGCDGRDAGGGASGDEVADGAGCSADAVRRWVDANMRDYYLFYDRVPTVDLTLERSPEALIRALRVPPDSFSYVGDAATGSAFFEEGKDFGYGWLLERGPDERLAVLLVQPGSPLDGAGVGRGDVLRAVAGVDVDDIRSDGRAAELLGSGTEERTVTMTFESATGARRTVEVTRGEYPVRSVLDARVIDRGAARVGYLDYLTFIEPGRAELRDAFAAFAEAGVTELVLDLRYNSGGRVDVAKDLASRIVGASAAGEDFLRYRLNDKYQDRFDPDSLRVPFVSLPGSLNLSRAYVLTTARTCSASELVVNGLAPFVDEVVTVGSASCGKPFATRGRERCGKVMQAVEYASVNARGEGGYVDGLPATCAAVDHPAQALGDPRENLLASALAHIETGACPAAAVAEFEAMASAAARAKPARPRVPPNLLDPQRNELE